MNRIKLHEDIYLSSDEHNWIVQERKVVKEGKRAGDEVYKNIGYFPNIEQSILFIINAKLKKSKSLEDLLSKVSELPGEILKGLEQSKSE